MVYRRIPRHASKVSLAHAAQRSFNEVILSEPPGDRFITKKASQDHGHPDFRHESTVRQSPAGGLLAGLIEDASDVGLATYEFSVSIAEFGTLRVLGVKD